MPTGDRSQEAVHDLGRSAAIPIDTDEIEREIPAVQAESTRVFLSHSSRDRSLAEYIEDIIESADQTFQIFRSSRPGAIPIGEDWLGCIRRELAAAHYYIVLVTYESLERPWIWFEMGAGWISAGRLIPVAAGISDLSAIPNPLSGIQIARLEIPDEAREAFATLGLRLTDPAGFSARIRELTAPAGEVDEEDAEDPN